jgi:hypothetical protein
MNYLAKVLCAFALFGFSVILAAPIPAAAISADLANKCRQMAMKAHPPQRVGTKTGTAGEERKYYRHCLANGGAAPEENTQNSPVAPSR